MERKVETTSFNKRVCGDIEYGVMGETAFLLCPFVAFDVKAVVNIYNK